MQLEGHTILVYYPDEEKAFRISSRDPAVLPFFEAFLGVSQGISVLSDLGFELYKNELKEGILTTYWTPPQSLADRLGHFVLRMEKNKIISTELRDKDGKTVVSTVFEDHVKHGSIFFPMVVTTTRFQETGNAIEKVTYDNPVFDEPLPPGIVDFQIPRNVQVKELQW